MQPVLARLRHVAPSLLMAACLSFNGESARAMGPGVSAATCGALKPPGQLGPYDHRTVPSVTRHLVEDWHFTPAVQAGTGGATGPFGHDVDFTLRAFPNNPRALLAISNYSLKHRSERVEGATYIVECYFERAMRFQPDDPMVHVLYAIYLKDRKRMSEVRPELEEAERLRGDQSNFDLDYNLGLLFYDVGAFDQAQTAAKRAYALGAQMPGLRKKLQAVGKWKDDPVPPPPPVDAAKADPAVGADAKADAADELKPALREPASTR